MAILIPLLLKRIFFLEAASAFRGQCEDELRPAERLSKTCLEQIQG